MSTILNISNSSGGGNSLSFDVLSFDFNLTKKVGQKVGVIDSKSSFVELTVEIISDDDKSLFIYGSYINHTLLSGSIIASDSLLSMDNNVGDEHQIIFNSARVYSLTESYDIERTTQRSLTLRMVATSGQVEGVEFGSKSSSINI